MTNLIHSRLVAIATLLTLLFVTAATSCDSNEPHTRSEKDILGIWTDGEGRYMHLCDDIKAYNIYLSDDDNGETVAELQQDGYFYEPGYNIVIYIDYRSQPDIYQIVELSETELVWCWVDNLLDENYNGLSVSEIIGNVIKQAHDGYTLDPDLYQHFHRVTDSEYEQLLQDFSIEEC